MENYLPNERKIRQFDAGWFVANACMSRRTVHDSWTLRITMHDSNGAVECWALIRPTDEACVEALMLAEQITISRIADTQLEFGTIHVECFGESYFEFWCDEARLTEPPVQTS